MWPLAFNFEHLQCISCDIYDHTLYHTWAKKISGWVIVMWRLKIWGTGPTMDFMRFQSSHCRHITIAHRHTKFYQNPNIRGYQLFWGAPSKNMSQWWVGRPPNYTEFRFSFQHGRARRGWVIDDLINFCSPVLRAGICTVYFCPG